MQLAALQRRYMPDETCSSRALELVDLLGSVLKAMPSREVDVEAVGGFAAGLDFSSKVRCRCSAP